MANTTFRHGYPRMEDYTPSSGAITAGNVVQIGTVTANTAGSGSRALIAHADIANNAKGSLAAGGGIYTMLNLNNAADGAKVYWDPAGNAAKVTTVSTNNCKMGYVVEGTGGGGANSSVDILHDPNFDA